MSLQEREPSKNKQMEPHQIEKLMHSKGNYQHNEKAAYWTENISANNIPDMGLIPNYTRNLYNSTWKQQKLGIGCAQTFFQRKNISSQRAHEKMLNISNHWEYANQSHNELSPHTF